MVQGTRARRYGGRSADERREARRLRLRDAALALFGTEGYAGTSIERLCAEAGVTARHFYEEHEGREALLLTLFESILADARADVVQALAEASDDPRDRVERAVVAFLHSYLDDPRRARVATLEVVGVSPAMERRRRQAIHEFARLIELQAERLATEGAVAPRDFELASIAMAGAGHELVVEWLWREEKPSLEALGRELVELFVAIIRGAGKP